MSDQPIPPMEEILASIRKIIAEDKPIAAPAIAESEAEEDVLELGEAPAEPAPTYFPPPPVAVSPPPASPLMSGEAAAASRKALSALSSLKLDPDAPADTLDGLVREMLRPMLKQWLDANLPELVERVVAREIARLGAR
ncbi:hypothetical protein FHS31_000518 [Sphingomonas vulcanisoli]|uniref:DUF2497 domain-containing protein n=1 Tax=Sphingomonas vulcanisoli TaxID=1658060 RepID=A0ABX0TNC6_9SPHN|nr:DUF2497 domain-containing protein [Sphingomonas vulcanisoli]NIJ06936.1 hypothetical protein [Sphingomonas vulcanisoli]